MTIQASSKAIASPLVYVFHSRGVLLVIAVLSAIGVLAIVYNIAASIIDGYLFDSEYDRIANELEDL